MYGWGEKTCSREQVGFASQSEKGLIWSKSTYSQILILAGSFHSSTTFSKASHAGLWTFRSEFHQLPIKGRPVLWWFLVDFWHIFSQIFIFFLWLLELLMLGPAGTPLTCPPRSTWLGTVISCHNHKLEATLQSKYVWQFYSRINTHHSSYFFVGAGLYPRCLWGMTGCIHG